MTKEDEQRLFTEKLNKTFYECLNLSNEGWPKEEVLSTMNDLIKNIPDAPKCVNYWIFLVHADPLRSSFENMISVCEKDTLARAQPTEEMWHAIEDILAKKSEEKVKFGESSVEACPTKEQTQEVNNEETVNNLESRKCQVENKHHKNMIFQDWEKEQVGQTKIQPLMLKPQTQ